MFGRRVITVVPLFYFYFDIQFRTSAIFLVFEKVHRSLNLELMNESECIALQYGFLMQKERERFWKKTNFKFRFLLVFLAYVQFNASCEKIYLRKQFFARSFSECQKYVTLTRAPQGAYFIFRAWLNFSCVRYVNSKDFALSAELFLNGRGRKKRLLKNFN